MERKGFPESYDVRRLVRFMHDVKSGLPEVSVPVYSHVIYDIVPDRLQMVCQPDIVIVEGLNVLQTGDGRGQALNLFVSDFFDFSLYVDAEEQDIQNWYIERFLTLRETGLPGSGLLLPPLLASHRQRGGCPGAPDLERHQRGQPAGEHPPHAQPRSPDPQEGPRPPRPERAPAQALMGRGPHRHSVPMPEDCHDVGA